MTYIVAEAGSNWIPNDLGSALALVDAAAEAGADAVKFQYFRVDAMDRPQEWRERCRPWELPEAWVGDLCERAREAGLDFVLSLFGWNVHAASYCDRLKIASSELGNRGLLQVINKQMIVADGQWAMKVYLSTGEAGYNAHQIGLALAWLNRCDVTLLHCVCQYPTPVLDVHLGRMEWLARTFGLPVGWSSHLAYPEAVAVTVDAVQRGASVVEVHLKLETTPEICPDSGAWSLLPGELAELVEEVRNAT